MEYLLEEFEVYLAELTLRPSDGGRFEVSVDGDTIFSKLDVGRFPGQEELIRLVGEKLEA